MRECYDPVRLEFSKGKLQQALGCFCGNPLSPILRVNCPADFPFADRIVKQCQGDPSTHIITWLDCHSKTVASAWGLQSILLGFLQV